MRDTVNVVQCYRTICQQFECPSRSAGWRRAATQGDEFCLDLTGYLWFDWRRHSFFPKDGVFPAVLRIRFSDGVDRVDMHVHAFGYLEFLQRTAGSVFIGC